MSDDRNVTQVSPDGTDPVEATAIAWFARRSDGLNEHEAAALTAWLTEAPLHRTAFAEIEAMWAGFDEMPADVREPVPLPRTPRRWLGPAMAASIALVMVSLAPSTWETLIADAQTGTGEIRMIRLGDGSIASLDADSAIDVAIDADERRIRLLRGRAWFSVAPEARPFVVDVGHARVRDIGTAFEVAERGDGGSVAVSEGLVELTLRNGPALRLSEGQGARFGADGAARHMAVPRSIAAWRSGRLQFVNAPLAEVLADLRRHGAGRVIAIDEDLSRRRISGSVATSDPEAAMDAVLALVGAKAGRLGPLILVRKT